MRYSGFFALIFVLNALPAGSQEITVLPETEGDLYLNFRNINFVKNNEYSNPITEGYTLIGYFIQPELVYQPDEKITLRLGAHMLSYSGTGKFSLVKPLFSTVWHFSENTSFTIGSLSGSDSHKMLDPHFNRERVYNAFSEDGLQLRSSGDRFFSDTWLSWENYIFKGDNDREVFTAGESFRYSSPSFAGILNLEIPVQVLVKHYGGQISDYPGQVETYLNIATGAKVIIDIDESKCSAAGLESTFFRGSSLTGNAPSGINTGYAAWHKLFYTCKTAELEAGYWSSHDFYAPDGNFIFSSVSDHLEDLVISDRNLITCSVVIKLPYRDFFEFCFGFDGYYDTDLKRFDNAMMLHIRIDKLIRIASIKK